MATEETSQDVSPVEEEADPPGGMIIQFLNDMEEGATSAEIVRHLRYNYGEFNNDERMNRAVEKILEKGTALGFLQRKGSHYLNWEPRETCCRKQMRRRSRSRRRKICRRPRRRTRRC